MVYLHIENTTVTKGDVPR